jgi:hypothetical protein
MALKLVAVWLCWGSVTFAIQSTVNSFTGRNAGKPVPSGPVADRKDPKVTRSVA